jgi:hypothetical protein
LSLAESGIDGKSKKRGRTTVNLKFFGYITKSYLSLVKPPCFEEINRKWLKYVETGPRRFPCFLLAGDLEGNVPIGSPLLFGHFPKCLCYCPLWDFPES